MNSTPATSASTIRLTALEPPPPTPTTRSTGCPAGLAVPKGASRWPASPRANASSSVIMRRARPPAGVDGSGASMRFSGISAENALRRRSWGVGRRSSSSASTDSMRPASDGCGTSRGGISSTGVRSGSAAWASSSVLRKSAASGPSLMLARLPDAMSENLLRKVAIGLGGGTVRVVLQDGHALHGRLGEAHRLADARGEHPVAEVLLEDLDRLLGVDRPRVHERRQDPLDLH